MRVAQKLLQRKLDRLNTPFKIEKLFVGTFKIHWVGVENTVYNVCD